MAISRPPQCSTQLGSGEQCDALGCREALSMRVSFAHALTLVPLSDFVELVTTEVSRPLRGGEALRTAD
jgi:hypothetical protein